MVVLFKARSLIYLPSTFCFLRQPVRNRHVPDPGTLEQRLFRAVTTPVLPPIRIDPVEKRIRREERFRLQVNCGLIWYMFKRLRNSCCDVGSVHDWQPEKWYLTTKSICIAFVLFMRLAFICSLAWKQPLSSVSSAKGTWRILRIGWWSYAFGFVSSISQTSRILAREKQAIPKKSCFPLLPGVHT